MTNKKIIVSLFIAVSIFFFTSDAKAIPPGAVPPSAVGSSATTYASTGCSAGQSYPKSSPGLGNGACATNRCMANGYLNIAICVPETVCAGMRGSPIKNSAGAVEGWGCDTSKDVCCIAKKNRCNDSSTEMNKVYVCSTASQCTTGGGGTPYSGGPSGCNPTGAYPVCCELKDSVTDPQPSVGEPIVPLPAGRTGAGGGLDVKRRKFVDINAFCFTQAECDLAAGPSNWVAGQGCPKKGNIVQGYCMSPDPDYQLQYPIAGVTTINGLKNFIGLIFNYGMGIIIIAAALLFIYGGIRYMFSAVANDIQVAKTIMIDSLAGLVLGLGAYAILANINVNTTILRSYKVPMINRLSFVDVLYCRDVKPAEGKTEAMFQDGGPPDNPTEFDVKKGFTKKLAQTECGREYFVEGGDSLSVCKGESCAGGKQCFSCAGGLPGCRTASINEHVCLDYNMGGSIRIGYPMTANFEGKWGNRKIQAYMFCITDDTKESGRKFEKLSEYTLVDKETTNGLSGGAVASYGFSFDFDKVDQFKKACTGKSGMVIEHHLDTDWKFLNLGFGVNVFYLTNKSCSFNNANQEIFKQITSWSIDSAVQKMYEAVPGRVNPNYTWTFDNAWTLDEILATKTALIRCDIDMGVPSTSLGNWHDW